MENLLFYLIIYITEGLILWIYGSKLFETKYRKSITIPIILFSHCLIAPFALLQNSWLNSFLFLLINVLLLYFLFQASILHVFFHSIGISFFVGLSELIVLNLMPHYTYTYYKEDSLLRGMLVPSILSKLLYFFILYAVSTFLSRKKHLYTRKNWYTLLLSVLPIVSVWVILTLMYVEQQVDLSLTTNVMIILSCILLLFVNLLVFGLYDYMLNKTTKQTQLQLELQKESDLVNYYKLLFKQDEQLKIFIHDIKKHLIAINDLNSNNNKEMISQYIEKLTNSPELRTYAKPCDNDILNSILSRYISYFAENKIRFSSDIRSHAVDFLPFDDMTSLFCNLMDNSLEAARKVEDSYVELNIYQKLQNNCTVLTLVNSCAASPYTGKNQLKTTKSDPERHGFGIKSIERIVEKHNGIMQMYYDNTTMTFHTIISFQGHV